MRFKVGDTVKLKDGLKTSEIYGIFYLTDDMVGFSNNDVMQVVEIFPFSYMLENRFGRRLKYFTDEMLELVDTCEDGKKFDKLIKVMDAVGSITSSTNLSLGIKKAKKTLITINSYEKMFTRKKSRLEIDKKDVEQAMVVLNRILRTETVKVEDNTGMDIVEIDNVVSDFLLNLYNYI